MHERLDDLTTARARLDDQMAIVRGELDQAQPCFGFLERHIVNLLNDVRELQRLLALHDECALIGGERCVGSHTCLGFRAQYDAPLPAPDFVPRD